MDKFNVKREHYGDKYYERGDIREADAKSVAHLIRNGVLVPVTAKDQLLQGSKEVTQVALNEPLQVYAVEPSALAHEAAQPVGNKAEPAVKNKAEK